MDTRRIPIIGHDLYQAGQVIDVVSQPCGPDPFIAVRAAFLYAPTLVWSLYKPEALDMAFDRAGRPHKRRRSRRFRAQDVWQIDPNPRGKLGWAMWRTAMLGERIGWYLLVLDATTDWLINWTSLAWQWSGCRQGDLQMGRYWRDTPLTQKVPTKQEMTVTGEFNRDDNGCGSHLTYVSTTVPGPHQFVATVSAQATGYDDVPAYFGDVYATRQVQGVHVDPLPLTRTPREGQPDQWKVAKNYWSGLEQPSVYRVHATCSGEVTWLEAQASVSLGEQVGLLPDP